MDINVLKIKIYQPFACYREPLVMSIFIPSLPLPPATTIVGMIANALDDEISDELLDSIKVSVIGKAKGFFIDYQRLTRIKDNLQRIAYEENIQPVPAKIQILTDIDLTIYINSVDNNFLKKRLLNPNNYLTLGRKEDFVIIKQIDIVTTEEILTLSVEDAIEKNFILKNTYIPYVDEISIGYLYNLPEKYGKNRELKMGKFLYISENTEYIGGNFFIDKESEVTFRWMT